MTLRRAAVLILMLTLIPTGCSSPESREIKKLRKQLFSEEWGVRYNAARDLAKMGTDEAIDAMIHGLRAPMGRVISLNERFVEMGERAVPKLNEALDSRNSATRVNTAELLAEIADPRSVPALLEALEDSRNREDLHTWYNVSGLAARALGEIGAKEAVEPICRILDDDDYPGKAHRDAGAALGKIGDKAAIGCLSGRLDDSPNEDRHIYAKSLAQLGDERGSQVLLADLEKSHDRKRDAAIALAGLGRKEMAPVLYEVIMETPSNTMDSYPLFALADLGPAATPYLLKLMSRPPDLDAQFQYNMSKQVISSLGRTGDPEAVDPLILKMNQTPYVRKYFYQNQPFQTIREEEVGFFHEALAALTVLGSPAVPALIAELERRSDPSREAYIIDALGKIGDERAREVISMEMESGNPELLEAGQKALENMDSGGG